MPWPTASRHSASGVFLSFIASLPASTCILLFDSLPPIVLKPFAIQRQPTRILHWQGMRCFSKCWGLQLGSDFLFHVFYRRQKITTLDRQGPVVANPPLHSPATGGLIGQPVIPKTNVNTVPYPFTWFSKHRCHRILTRHNFWITDHGRFEPLVANALRRTNPCRWKPAKEAHQ